ncbi:MAG TPA: RDD family protein [Anaeromyxobacter sp.]|nr:RDD family protein [Anaeromyxobacter sp.]
MSEASWYYLEAGHQAGPVEEATIIDMIRSGRLPAGANVWRAGMSGWQPWNTIPELASAAPPGATGPGALPPRPQHAAPHAYGQQFVYPKAPLGARFVAHIVDGFLFMLPAIVLIIVAVVAGENENGAAAAICGILGGVLMLVGVVYNFIKDGRANGQSVGKKIMNLMVVHLPTNMPCTKAQSAGRAAIMMALGLIPYVGGLIEPIVVLAAGDGRRIGDRAANTQVVSVDDYRRRYDVDAFS